jgi:hypothetical protein
VFQGECFFGGALAPLCFCGGAEMARKILPVELSGISTATRRRGELRPRQLESRARQTARASSQDNIILAKQVLDGAFPRAIGNDNIALSVSMTGLHDRRA